MISSNSGWSSGSPPLIVITDVPSSASLSTRSNMVSVGTGLEKSSYSLQYSQARLQRRIGIMCASRGGSGENSARKTPRVPRTVRNMDFKRRRKIVRVEGIIFLIQLLKHISHSFGQVHHCAAVLPGQT